MVNLKSLILPNYSTDWNNILLTHELCTLISVCTVARGGLLITKYLPRRGVCTVFYGGSERNFNSTKDMDYCLDRWFNSAWQIHSESLISIIECFFYQGRQRYIVSEFKARALVIEIISELMLRDLAKVSWGQYSAY